MLPTRRALLGSGATILGATALSSGLMVPSAFAGKSWEWKHYGADPFATSEGDALAKLPQALKLLGIPARYHAQLLELVRTHPQGMRNGNLARGDHLEAMLSSGGVVHKNVVVAFEDTQRGIGPTAHTREWDFPDGTLIEPLVCFNWCWKRVCQSCSCFSYQVNGLDDKGQPLVPVPDHAVKIPLELALSFFSPPGVEIDWRSLETDTCFYAVDGATGRRLRLVHECDICIDEGQQTVWPSDVPVGTTTELTFSVYDAERKKLGFESGYGTVFVPRWLIASSLWCFGAPVYEGSSPTWYSGRSRKWRYSGYYDLVTLGELQPVLKSGADEFPRTIRPLGVLGQ